MSEDEAKKALNNKKRNKISKNDISVPTNFRIVQHIGFSGRNKIEVCCAWKLE